MKYKDITSAMEQILSSKGFTCISTAPQSPEAMGAWYVDFQTDEFIVTVSQERTGDSVELGFDVSQEPMCGDHGQYHTCAATLTGNWIISSSTR